MSSYIITQTSNGAWNVRIPYRAPANKSISISTFFKQLTRPVRTSLKQNLVSKKPLRIQPTPTFCTE